MTQHKTCRENHADPPNELTENHRRIGMIAGWEVFSEFVKGGGYGVDQSILDAIISINSDYQSNEFTPRQEEANSIIDSLNEIHTANNNSCPICGEVHVDRAGYAEWRDTQIARLNELSTEIDAVYSSTCDGVYALVGATAYEAFLADE